MGVFQKVVENDFAKFKWEFLRRNKSYCEEWKKLKNSSKKYDLVQNKKLEKLKKAIYLYSQIKIKMESQLIASVVNGK